jgi:NAD(P) transhydrogenase subunit alpha
MKIGVPAEIRPGETRVTATPETVKKLVAGKHAVMVQSGAGVPASFPDDAYTAAGAMLGGPADVLGAELVLKVRTPVEQEFALMKRGTVLVGILEGRSTTMASAR